MKIRRKIYFSSIFYGFIVFLMVNGFILLRLNIKFILCNTLKSFNVPPILSEYNIGR